MNPFCNKKTIAVSIGLALSLGLMHDVSAQQNSASTDNNSTETTERKPVGVSETSNTTNSNATKRATEQLETVKVTANALGAGLMSVQDAPKAVSTITREAIEEAPPGSNFTQMLESVPGAYSASDDITGMQDGQYNIRGFTQDEIGVTVNGAPLNDAGSYQTYATEYGDTSNMGDITVLQGIPDVDMPDTGAAGGHIAWATLTPYHQFGVNFEQSLGSNNYRRSFVRLNTGDMGPVRGWLSYSNNESMLWRGKGHQHVEKYDGKLLWDINDGNSITASFQYNRQFKNRYRNVSKQDVAQNGYDYSWDETWTATKLGTYDSNYYKLHTNAFKTLVFSLDGEFTLSDNLRMSVVPYLIWNDGGSGTGNYFTETKYADNEWGYYNGDLNQNGVITNNQKAQVYAFSNSTTYRPGVTLKLNQDLGMDNSLEYGLWYERSRQQQWQGYSMVNAATGVPYDNWSNDDSLLRYPNGSAQLKYNEYTTTEVKKGFVTDTWTPNDKWTFSAGLAYLYVTREGSAYEYPGADYGTKNSNYDKYDLGNLCNATSVRLSCGSSNLSASFHKVLPTLGVKYALDERNQFFYGIGSSYRVPPNLAVFMNQVLGKQANQPETSWNNDLGYRYYGDAVSVSASLYQSNFRNKTVSAYDDTSGQTYFLEIPKMRMRGLNAEGSWNMSHQFTLYGSYTYTQAKMMGNMNEGDDGIIPTKGKTMTSTPRNMLYARLRFHQGPFFASIGAKYSSAIWGDYVNSEKAGGYTTVSASAGWHLPDTEMFKHSSIRINGSNLLNRKAYTYAVANEYSHASGNTVYDGQAFYSSGLTNYSLLQPRAYVVTFRTEFQ
ncbi:TonB-dependent receptor [Dyella sp. 20L07]|uniref:TonB-dependent receptor n=1 Tax=Dyella sp. 20L07 TaxID=3384240 RepID=UPI003D2B1663